MDNKMIAVLLVAAIVLSLFSLAVTMSLNVENLPFVKTKTVTIFKGADAEVGTVGLTILSTPKNS